MSKIKLVSVVASCYNEEGNILELYERIIKVFDAFENINYEIIICDNKSTDNTRQILEEIASKDKQFKCIFNEKNFGHIRSPYYGVLQAKGDAVVQMASDLEDPPELIKDFVTYWLEGTKVCVGVHNKRDQLFILKIIRNFYYWLINFLAEEEQIKNFAGFALYSREVIETIKKIEDPYPYIRGLICQLGYKRKEVLFHKPLRKRGISKGSFLIYFDMALLAIVSQSRFLLRLSTLIGIFLCVLNFAAGLGYFIYKLLYWDSFEAGITPIMLTIFFFFGWVFIFLGIIGEYVAYLVPRVNKHPIVVVEKKINFES